MGSLMHRLITNVEAFECLKLDDTVDDFPALLRAIRSSVTVKNVIIQLPFPLDLNDEQRRSLMEAIGHLAGLERLSLECLSISQNTLHDFVAALQRTARPPLQEFCAWDLPLEDGVTLVPLVLSLSSLPTLEKVAIGVENSDQGPALDSSSVFILCSNPRLTSLRLANIGLDTNSVRSFTEALELNNDTLKSLEIHGEILEPAGWVAIARMLERNTSLQNFKLFDVKGMDDESIFSLTRALRFNETQGGKVGNVGVSAIAEMLPHNNMLEKTSLCCQQGLDDTGLIAIAKGLKQNNSLKHLLIEDDDEAVTNRGYEALVDMLQTNTTLETIYHDNAGDLKLKINYFMKLNQSGIRNLLLNVNATKDQLLDAIWSHEDDIDCIYYVLLTNPSFISPRASW